MVQTLRELYVHKIREIYNAEIQCLYALPKLAKASVRSELRDAFQEHLRVTERQKQRLERIFDLLDEHPNGKKCQEMAGLIADIEPVLKNEAEADVLDIVLINSAKRIEHWEIAVYGSLQALAEELTREEDGHLLRQTLDEERKADHIFTNIARTIITSQIKNLPEYERRQLCKI